MTAAIGDGGNPDGGDQAPMTKKKAIGCKQKMGDAQQQNSEPEQPRMSLAEKRASAAEKRKATIQRRREEANRKAAEIAAVKDKLGEDVSDEDGTVAGTKRSSGDKEAVRRPKRIRTTPAPLHEAGYVRPSKGTQGS
ncbi:hypothetical protein Moror_11197 [Moniliophthora roreri MCA 2997]|uniref:Uncharacterized protein n=1 Tax=Moniliophthora roreri (strain MCA 2997) TaxID=1381753 RepID=V2WR39_MONRO|nr:hypothetical protein Moror_11197 [Moniliophthora roreri MCA 2997]